MQVAFVRDLGIRGKIFAGYIAILLMALALLGFAAALTSKTHDLLRDVSSETIPSLIALDTLLEKGLRLTNAADRLAFAAASRPDGQAPAQSALTPLRAAVAQAVRQFKAALERVEKADDLASLSKVRSRLAQAAGTMLTHAGTLLSDTAQPTDPSQILVTRNSLDVQSDTLSMLITHTIDNQRHTLTTSQVDVERRVQTMLIYVFVGVIVICLATIVGGKIVSGYIIRPILQLRESAVRIGRGDPGAPPAKLSNDEVGTLVEAFAAMVTQLRAAQDQLMHNERLATLGQVAGTVSHELRNPLAAIRNSMAVARQLMTERPAGVDRALDRADRNIERCARIIDDLLEFTRAPELNREPTPLDEWLGDVLDGHALPEGIVIDRDLTCASSVALDRSRFRDVIANLLDNAAQALADPGWTPPAGSKPAISLRAEAAGPLVRLSVGDNGPGISPEQLPKIFQPLFTTKSFGVGLGLPIVRQIVEQHGGTIEVTSRLGEGASFVIWLPRLADAPSMPDTAASQAA
ncbi:MAG TPA: HAMP domain-containing sensor histidine kinase [Dongiaceae bacterium]|nr:HAMP domain-containing sensor histidine kinase [Dongiaceae bacterium]